MIFASYFHTYGMNRMTTTVQIIMAPTTSETDSNHYTECDPETDSDLMETARCARLVVVKDHRKGMTSSFIRADLAKPITLVEAMNDQ